MVGSPSDTRVNETVADSVCDPEHSDGRAVGLASILSITTDGV